MGSTLVNRRCSPSPSRAAVSRRFSTGPTNGPCSWRPTASSHRSGPACSSPGTARGSIFPSLRLALGSSVLSLGLITRHDPSIAGRHDPLPGEPGRVRGRWYRLGHLDGFQAYRADVGQNLPISCGLKSLAKFVGLEPVEVDRRRIHELTPEEMHAYVLSDARLARQLVERRADRFAWVDQDPSSSG